MTRTAGEVARVQVLADNGLNDCEISRRTGIPRSTVRAWRSGQVPTEQSLTRTGTCYVCAGYRFPVPGASDHAYAYLLGLYLGDGHIATHPKGVYRLRIYLDRRHRIIVQECEAALAILAPENRVTTVRCRDANMDIPGAFSCHWPCVFPQHGRGRKHLRSIVLQSWQREILDRYPGRFLRGLIHSDGCRSTNTIRHPKKTYQYPRYQFSNRSDDIRGLFCEYCDKVGADWRRMNRWTISVARRDSVAVLDRHIGPKR